MKYSLLGHTGLAVSKLTFGAMTFGEPSNAGGFASIFKVDQKGADRLVAMSLDRGVNFFDTADVYCMGRSEEMLGLALGQRRQDVVIATKVGARMGETLTRSGLSRRHILQSVEGSLKRLGTDWIDVYIAHRPDPLTPLEETLAALDAVVRAGKVRYLGFSNWPAWMAAKAMGMQAANGWARFVTGQMYYSLVCRDLEHEIVPFARDAGVGIMVWSPLASGFLSGKYTRADPSGGGGRLSQYSFMPLDREKGYAIVDVLSGIAEAHGATPATVALAWLIDRPAVATLVLGANNEAQLEANLAATDLELSAAERAELDKVSAMPDLYPTWFGKLVDDAPMRQALGSS